LKNQQIKAAIDKYLEFHQLEPKSTGVLESFTFPKKVYLLGEAKTTYYESDKWTGKIVSYYHDHEGDVKAYSANEDDGGKPVSLPPWIHKTGAIAVLGKCLGFDFQDGKDLIEAKASKTAKLYTIPSGKALIVVERGQPCYFLWGGSLDVRDVGIVG